MKSIKSLLAAFALSTFAAQASAVAITGTLDSETFTPTVPGSSATWVNTPATPSVLSGTFDGTEFSFTVEEYDSAIAVDLSSAGLGINELSLDRTGSKTLVSDGNGSSFTTTASEYFGTCSAVSGALAATLCSQGFSGVDAGGTVAPSYVVNSWDGATGSITLSTNNGAQTATYSMSAVPVPAAAWLFGSALVGLVGVGRRRRK